jgi:hypothetical protein
VAVDAALDTSLTSASLVAAFRALRPFPVPAPAGPWPEPTEGLLVPLLLVLGRPSRSVAESREGLRAADASVAVVGTSSGRCVEVPVRVVSEMDGFLA